MAATAGSDYSSYSRVLPENQTALVQHCKLRIEVKCIVTNFYQYLVLMHFSLRQLQQIFKFLLV